MRKPFALAASILALVLVFSSCATTNQSGDAVSAGGPTYPVSINIDNNLSNLQAVTIYIARESGGRQMLGSVESGRKHTFTYNASNGVHTLSARRGSGQQDITSERIQFAGPMAVTWHLSQNQVVVGN
ncbi:MAG TPA: hypothetical protein VF035_01320 [Longimicrobiales bacterium]